MFMCADRVATTPCEETPCIRLSRPALSHPASSSDAQKLAKLSNAWGSTSRNCTPHRWRWQWMTMARSLHGRPAGSTTTTVTKSPGASSGVPGPEALSKQVPDEPHPHPALGGHIVHPQGDKAALAGPGPPWRVGAPGCGGRPPVLVHNPPFPILRYASVVSLNCRDEFPQYRQRRFGQ